MKFGLGNLGLRSAPSIPRRVAALLRRFNASLILPGEQTPVLGPELVVNGDFSNSSSWPTKQSTWAVSGGSAVANATVSSAFIAQPSVTLVTGRLYFVTFSILDYSAGSVAPVVGDNIGAYVSAAGTYSQTVIAGANASYGVGFRTTNGPVTLKVYNYSVREILSYSDTHNGFRTGNWTDSVGTTPATIDGKVGLVTDAAGSVGANVAPALEAANWSVVGNDATHMVTWQPGGGFRFQSDTTSPQLVVQSTYKLVLGKYYEFFITVSAYTSGSIKTDSVSGSAVIPASVGTHRFVGVAQSTTLQFTRNSTNVDLTVSSLQVRELTGIHALQATDGFKPVERRGLVNLLTYSTFQNGLTDASIRGGNLSLSSMDGYGNAVAFGYDGATLTYAYKGTFSAVNGTIYTMAAVVKMDDGLAPSFGSSTPNTSSNPFAFVIGGSVPDPTGFSVTSLGNSLYMVVCVSGGSVTQPTSNGVIKYAQNNNRTFKVTNYALFTGTVTAQQILDAGGIPVTTDAPKSSSLGPRYWQFDGVDDRLQLSAVPFQMSDDFAIVAGVERTADSAGWQTIHSVYGNGVRFQFCFEIGKLNGYMTDGDGHTLRITASTALALNTKAVVSIRKVGSTVVIRQNGVQVGGGSFAATATYTATASQIGAWSDFDGFGGKLFCLPISKGAITDAELLLLEKFAGKLAGVQI